MVHCFYGSDVTKVRTEALKKAHELAGDGEMEVLTIESGGGEILRDATGATSLFQTHETFVLDTFSDDKELFEVLLQFLPDMAASQNAFVVILGTLGVKDVKSFTEHSKSIAEYTLKEKKEFNVFALSDALLARDKKTLWILLQEAWRDRKTSEEVIGTLFWQLKMLRLAEVTKSALEAGQKPFVYDKAKRALRNFKEGEVVRLMHDLTMKYHEGHSGKRNIDHALESWVLKL